MEKLSTIILFLDIILLKIIIVDFHGEYIRLKDLINSINIKI